MKKIAHVAAALSFLFWGGCQTLQPVAKLTFEPFAIKKITSKGIETVQISSTNNAWPELMNTAATPLAIDGKNVTIAVIGDTGCRLKESKGKGTYQNCNSTKDWPFPTIAKSLASENYDFGIHTGDYHYREQCSDPKLCSVYGQRIGYGWEAWWDDFFGPSLELFKKTPWLFVRGNHEDCARAFKGWAALAPSTAKFSDTCEDIEIYQWTEFQDLVFINFDNSALEDRQPLTTRELSLWKTKLNEISLRISNLKSKKEIWFLAHKPIAAYVPNSATAEPEDILPNMSDLLKQANLFASVDVFLSGHIHNQQIIPMPLKTQLVVGQSGADLDPFGRKILTDKLITSTANKYDFGYALMHRQGFKIWDLVFKNPQGEVQMKCLMKNNLVTCD